MDDKQYTREQIHLILKEHSETGDTESICQKYAVTETDLYDWYGAYGANPVAKPNPLRRFMHEIFGGPPRITRREALIAGAAGAAGLGMGYFFASSSKNQTMSGGTGSIAVVDAKKEKNLTDKLGKYIYLTPQKLGGGTHAVDLETGKTLAWISYWNFGDSCPISHHLAAYPSPDPYKGFEFVNSTQGGDNVMIYGLPTEIKQRGLLGQWGQGNHIYRVKFDGQSMNLIEDVADTTGIGLGVHITILPDASGFAAADGQKDVAAFFDRAADGEKTKCHVAFRADWIGKNPDGNMEDNWAKGGTLRIERLVPAKETGKYDLQGAKGNKIDWEMVPMAENLVYTGQLPGASPRTLSGLDAVVHHPGNKYSALIIRMLSTAVIIDRDTYEPVACLHNPEGSPDNLEIKRVSSNPDRWEIHFDDIKCVGHEAGFSPDGKIFTMMNNIKQNNMAVFDTSDPNPRNWKRFTFVKHDKTCHV